GNPDDAIDVVGLPVVGRLPPPRKYGVADCVSDVVVPACDGSGSCCGMAADRDATDELEAAMSTNVQGTTNDKSAIRREFGIIPGWAYVIAGLVFVGIPVLFF